MGCYACVMQEIRNAKDKTYAKKQSLLDFESMRDLMRSTRVLSWTWPVFCPLCRHLGNTFWCSEPEGLCERAPTDRMIIALAMDYWEQEKPDGIRCPFECGAVVSAKSLRLHLTKQCHRRFYFCYKERNFGQVLPFSFKEIFNCFKGCFKKHFTEECRAHHFDCECKVTGAPRLAGTLKEKAYHALLHR